jgi:predicted Zn finger-like uncharacterized protein
MIVGCPGCRTRYLVDEQALGAGRIVRCATCGHTWHQKAPRDLLSADEDSRVEPALEVPPRPQVAVEVGLEVPPRPGVSQDLLPRPRSSRWSALRRLVFVVLFVLAIVAGVVIARDRVVKIWPSAARLFALVGLPGSELKPN